MCSRTVPDSHRQQTEEQGVKRLTCPPDGAVSLIILVEVVPKLKNIM